MKINQHDMVPQSGWQVRESTTLDAGNEPIGFDWILQLNDFKMLVLGQLK